MRFNQMPRPTRKLVVLLALGFIGSCALSQAQDAITCHRKGTGFGKAKFPNCVLLDNHTALHWKAGAEYIKFGVDMNIKVDWLGLGIGRARMPGADIWVVQHVGHAKWEVEDRFAEGFEMPSLDEQQDVVLLAAHRDELGTRATFKRKYDTCDGRDNKIVKGAELSVLHAFGTGPFAYHGPSNRGALPVVLVVDPANPPQPPLDLSTVTTMDIVMPNATVPSVKTSYMCINFPMPTDRKRHIVGFEFLSRTKYLHHLDVYGCTLPPTHSGMNEVYDCLNMAKMECQVSMAIGIPGTVGIVQPPAVAGYPIGPNDVQVLMLQTHYDNPNGDVGQVDDSGFRIYITEELRQYDMGSMWLGALGWDPVPPGQPAFTLHDMICPGACTGSMPTPIVIYQSYQHMHLAGLASITRHVRNGVELEPLDFVNYFDFWHQGPVVVNRTILPGDTLIHSCTQNTTGRTGNVISGYASEEEMCYNMVTYYPALRTLGFCSSMHETDWRAAGCMSFYDGGRLLDGTANLTAFAMTGKIVPVMPGDVNFQRNTDKCSFVRKVNSTEVVGYNGYGKP